MPKKLSVLSIFLLILLAIPNIVVAAPLFSDGFETGNFTNWTATSGAGATVQGVTVHHGSWAAKLEQNNYCRKHLGAASNTMYGRSYWQASAFPSAGNFAEIMLLDGDAGWFEGVIVQVYNDGGTAKLQLLTRKSDGSYETLTYGTGISINTWYCLELKFVRNAAGCALYLDGVKILESAETSTNMGGIQDLILTAAHWIGEMWNHFFDCVVMDSTYIGPEVAPDTTKPTYALINASTIIPAQICIFSCNWTDNVAMDWFIFGWNNSGVWINDSASYFNAGSWANVTKTLNATDGYTIQFEWWANDTSNNWNNTGIQSITLTSTDVLPYLAMGGILGGTGVMAIFLIRKKHD